MNTTVVVSSESICFVQWLNINKLTRVSFCAELILFPNVSNDKGKWQYKRSAYSEQRRALAQPRKGLHRWQAVLLASRTKEIGTERKWSMICVASVLSEDYLDLDTGKRRIGGSQIRWFWTYHLAYFINQSRWSLEHFVSFLWITGIYEATARGGINLNRKEKDFLSKESQTEIWEMNSCLTRYDRLSVKLPSSFIKTISKERLF